jgi:hypothetical protein
MLVEWCPITPPGSDVAALVLAISPSRGGMKKHPNASRQRLSSVGRVRWEFLVALANYSHVRYI